MAERGGHLTSMDPALQPEFVAWASGSNVVTHIAAPILDTIDGLRDVVAWIIDGDDTYGTVHIEPQAVNRVGVRDGKPLVVFLHDVSWPTARRDMYYAPERIPAAFCHPYKFGAGAILDCIDLVPGQGFRGQIQLGDANRSSGGPRNRVLIEVEDFIAVELTSGRTLAFAHIPAVFGLCVLLDIDASWRATLPH